MIGKKIVRNVNIRRIVFVPARRRFPARALLPCLQLQLLTTLFDEVWPSTCVCYSSEILLRALSTYSLRLDLVKIDRLDLYPFFLRFSLSFSLFDCRRHHNSVAPVYLGVRGISQQKMELPTYQNITRGLSGWARHTNYNAAHFDLPLYPNDMILGEAF